MKLRSKLVAGKSGCDGLAVLAGKLNTAATGTGGAVEAWRRFEEIITRWGSGRDADRQQAAAQFNSWAADLRVTLAVTTMKTPPGRRTPLPNVRIRGEDGLVVKMLFEIFFANPDRDRLKRCPECGRWFVDRSRPGAALRCSAACTNRWWNIERRRAAGHAARRTRPSGKEE